MAGFMEMLVDGDADVDVVGVTEGIDDGDSAGVADGETLCDKEGDELDVDDGMLLEEGLTHGSRSHKACPAGNDTVSLPAGSGNEKVIIDVAPLNSDFDCDDVSGGKPLSPACLDAVGANEGRLTSRKRRRTPCQSRLGVEVMPYPLLSEKSLSASHGTTLPRRKE